ncbi:hypothetical protein [Aquiflexum sp.]
MNPLLFLFLFLLISCTTNLEPKDNSNIEAFNAARKDLTYAGLRVLGIIK